MKKEGGIRIGRVVKMDLVRAGGILFGFIRRLWSWLFILFLFFFNFFIFRPGTAIAIARYSRYAPVFFFFLLTFFCLIPFNHVSSKG